MLRSFSKTLAATLVSGAMATAASADVIISQYTEGSGSFKAIEVYNSGEVSVNLDDYKLVLYRNGVVGSPTNFEFTANTVLEPGDTWVIAGTSDTEDPEEAPLAALADQISGGLNHNGNDPYALINTSTGTDVVVDFFGEYGGDDFAAEIGYTRTNFTPIADGVWNIDYWEEIDRDSIEGFGEAPTEGSTEPEEPSNFVCGELTPIYAIQGDGAASPLVTDDIADNEEVYTSGVVTSITTDIYRGFFIQDPAGDNNALTSDGIFVFTGSSSQPDIELGDEVCVLGTVSEFFDSTQISIDTDDVEVINSGNIVTATAPILNSESNLHDQLEAYEGMLITTTDSGLKVSRAFSFDFDAFTNNMAMSFEEPVFKSTHLYPAGSAEQITLEASNKVSTLIVETDSDVPDGVVPYFSGFNAEDGYIRVGDEITGLEGVLGYSFSNFRLIVSDGIDLSSTDFDHTENDRTVEGPELFLEGDLKVASFNVLNLFNSVLGGSSNPFGSNRGATTQAEFDLQITKIANAIVAIDADIVGLMEIENNGFDATSAIAALIDTINLLLPETAAPYSYVTAGDYIGTDAIAVGLIYRADTVELTGDAEKIDLPVQTGTDEDGDSFNVQQRVSLLQKFTHIASDKTLSVVVNHFKSKGSGCIEDTADPDDVQGSCNEFRVSAAMALGDYLANVDDNILILGDLNAYGQEDPIRVLSDYDACAVVDASDLIYTAGNTTLAGNDMHTEGVPVEQSFGFTNLADALIGPKAYTYTFDGELGSLDHVLANNTLLSYVVSVADWHINSAESSLFQYSSDFTGDLAKSTNAYSSSDHDPLVISIDFSSDANPSPVTAAVCDLDESGTITTSSSPISISEPTIIPEPTITPEPEEEENSSNSGGGSTDKFLLLLLSAIGFTRIWSRKK